MENAETEVLTKLDKLKRNMTRMTEAQKKQYYIQLENLKLEIAAHISGLTQEYWTLGYRFSKSSGQDDATAQVQCRKKCNDILGTGTAHDVLQKAFATLFETYSLSAYFKALDPLNDYMFFTVYSEYWLRHCKQEADTYSNDLINMRWDPDLRLWMDGSGAYAEMLPPTKELINEEFKNEMEWYGYPDWPQSFDSCKEK